MFSKYAGLNNKVPAEALTISALLGLTRLL